MRKHLPSSTRRHQRGRSPLVLQPVMIWIRTRPFQPRRTPRVKRSPDTITANTALSASNSGPNKLKQLRIKHMIPTVSIAQLEVLRAAAAEGEGGDAVVTNGNDLDLKAAVIAVVAAEVEAVAAAATNASAARRASTHGIGSSSDIRL